MAHHQLLEEKSLRHNNNNNNNNSNNNNNNIMVSSSSSSTFCYSSEISSTNQTTVHPTLSTNTHLHTNFDPNPEIYHLTSGLQMIGFQPKPLNEGSDFFHDHRGGRNDQHLMAVIAPSGGRVEDHHQVVGFMDESSLRTCVFPCEGNERPSQGLSLTLSSSNPSSIGVQSFELRNNHSYNQRFNLLSLTHNSRDWFLGKSSTFQPNLIHQQEFFLGKSVGSGSTSTSGATTTSSNNTSLQFEIMRNFKYMGPVQELLNEFCSLETQQTLSDHQKTLLKNKKKKKKDGNLELLYGVDDNGDNQINDNNASSSSSSRNIIPSLYGLSIMDLQKRKTKLSVMLEELDKRYKQYCDEKKAVEYSYESVAGVGTANVYTKLASKAMSRHFRCLRDPIVAQIKATIKAMGENSATSTVPGTSKGETPRLRILDQSLRQQKALQQMTLLETHPWRPQRGLPERAVTVLRAWLFEHFLHPYPSDVDKHILACQTGLTRSQVSNWFINARVRLWKPMVEQMYVEETKELQDKNMMTSSSDPTDHQQSDHDNLLHDPKPDPDELVGLNPGSLSSIVNTTTSLQNDNNAPHQNQPFCIGEGFGSMDTLAEFSSPSSYNHNHNGASYGAVQNDNNASHQGFGGGTSRGNNVSLTLGLQQHGENGVSLAISSASQSSLFYGRDNVDDCQPIQYSLLDGDQGQNLPYKNLMGAQLFHDFS